MVKKKLLVTAFTAVTMLSVTSAFAQDLSVLSDESVQQDNVGKRIKRHVKYGVEQQTFNSDAPKEYYVNIPDGYGWGKFYVRNDGNASMTLSFESTSSGKQTVLEDHVEGASGTVRIPAGESKTIYTTEATGTGQHRIQLHSGESQLKGLITYKYSNVRGQL